MLSFFKKKPKAKKSYDVRKITSKVTLTNGVDWEMEDIGIAWMDFFLGEVIVGHISETGVLNRRTKNGFYKLDDDYFVPVSGIQKIVFLANEEYLIEL